MLQDFKAFILRGNVIDLAIGVAIGAAFSAVVTAITVNMLTPLLALFGGGGTASDLAFTIAGSRFGYGAVIDAVVSFLITAAVLFFLVVRPVNVLLDRRRTEPDVASPTRPCPECLSRIPTAARRCSFCTAEVGAA